MMNAKQLIRDAEQRLLTDTHKTLKDASPVELHNAISGAAMDALAPLWKKKEENSINLKIINFHILRTYYSYHRHSKNPTLIY